MKKDEQAATSGVEREVRRHDCEEWHQDRCSCAECHQWMMTFRKNCERDGAMQERERILRRLLRLGILNGYSKPQLREIITADA